MGRWLLLLGGLLVWLVHFLGVYGLASVGVVVGEATGPAFLTAMGVLTLACAAANAAIGAVALRRLAAGGDELDRFIHGGGALGAGLSFVAVAWQGLPLLVGR